MFFVFFFLFLVFLILLLIYHYNFLYYFFKKDLANWDELNSSLSNKFANKILLLYISLILFFLFFWSVKMHKTLVLGVNQSVIMCLWFYE